MKYFIAIVVGFMITNTVYASDTLTGTEFMLNGRKYGGYTGSTIQVGDNVGTQGLVTTSTTTKALVGNTRIIDMINLIKNPTDLKTFLDIITRTGLKY